VVPGTFGEQAGAGDEAQSDSGSVELDGRAGRIASSTEPLFFARNLTARLDRELRTHPTAPEGGEEKFVRLPPRCRIYPVDHVEADCVGDAIRATEGHTAEERADLEKGRTMIEEAIRILVKPSSPAYSRALAVLRDEPESGGTSSSAGRTTTTRIRRASRDRGTELQHRAGNNNSSVKMALLPIRKPRH
jgi:hypothetical protein